MDSGFPETSIALPGMWPTVERVALNQTTLFYELGAPAPLRDESGRHRRDDRGRTALEAFLGLPLATMYGRLANYQGAAPAPDREVELGQAQLRAAFAEILRFVECFGPLGIGWSRTFRAYNREADRLAAENEELRVQLETLVDPSTQRQLPNLLQGGRLWHVVRPEVGSGPYAEVRPIRRFPGLSWEEQVKRDVGDIPHDRLGYMDAEGPLFATYEVLKETLELADSLASGDQFEIRHFLERSTRFDRVYFVDREGPVDPMAPNYGRAVRAMFPGDNIWRPLKDHQTNVDWETLGWTILTHHLSRMLTWGALRVFLRGNRPQLGWRVGSLVEVMYLQLLEQITAHPDFRMGHCDYCKAPILRVRREQRWHTGCAPAGRQRESRASRKARLVEPEP